MLRFNKNCYLRALAVVFFMVAMVEFGATPADARAGGGRSSGRSSGFGSRPFSSQPSQGSSRQYNRPDSSQSQGAPAPAPNSNGGFLRNMAGGLAGGFLGSMLFSSLGHAGGFGGAGGGSGLLQILMIAGLAYFGFRWWKNRSQINNFERTDSPMMNRYHGQSQSNSYAPASESIDSELASDLFFKVQGAWTRRDLTSVKDFLDTDIKNVLERDLAELKHKQQINRLENISVRRAEVINSWQEENREYSSVRFTANLLDYTTNETTGQLVAGSDSLPVKFDENWTFVKAPGTAAWQLAGIEQV